MHDAPASLGMDILLVMLTSNLHRRLGATPGFNYNVSLGKLLNVPHRSFFPFFLSKMEALGWSLRPIHL